VRLPVRSTEGACSGPPSSLHQHVELDFGPPRPVSGCLSFRPEVSQFRPARPRERVETTLSDYPVMEFFSSGHNQSRILAAFVSQAGFGVPSQLCFWAYGYAFFVEFALPR